MIPKPKKEYLKAFLRAMTADFFALWEVLAGLKCDLPKEHATKEQAIELVKYCVEEGLVACHLGSYSEYMDAVPLEKPLCFQYIEDPKYWKWPAEAAIHVRCVVLEITLKGLAIIGSFRFDNPTK